MSEGSHGGRPSSWLSVAVIVIGFTIGGVALCLGPSWPLLWTGVAVIGIGAVLFVAFGVFGDVVVDEPRVIPEIVHYSLFGRQGDKRRGGEHGETISTPSAGSAQRHPHG